MGNLPPSDGLNAGEWRDLGSVEAKAAGPVPVARRLSATRLHINARPASLAVERERAREIVGLAKESVTATFSDIRFGRKIQAANLAPMVSAIAASVARSPTALPSVTRIKLHDEYTYLHSVAVCGLMIALGNELRLSPELTQEIGLAGLLHDIGKARIDADLLNKPGPLDLDEYARVQAHTLRGYELLRDSGIESEIALDVCLHHHERIDGSGYPSGISQETLSIHARMAAVCDVFDAVTSNRAYKRSWSPGAALDWMMGTTGHFDPRVLRAFRGLLGVFPVGALVLLESQRLAVVVDEPADSPTTPDVAVFLCAVTKRELAPVRVGTRADPIIGLEVAAKWGLLDFEAKRERLLDEFGPA
ncbi:HD-GYP domain-containing protein [Sphingomonas sp. Sphisp140]|uniref:HD-GYP domain-containing protein n=1 Tax=unclassified Sphingomonas TaxID=196159 RepID=UPI0039AF8E49